MPSLKSQTASEPWIGRQLKDKIKENEQFFRQHLIIVNKQNINHRTTRYDKAE